MEKSRIAQFTAYFQSDSTAVWNAMTDHTDFSWRLTIENLSKYLKMEMKPAF